MLRDDAVILRGFARSLIRRKARIIARCDGFTAQDRRDIEQELRLRLNESLPRFNPQQGHINVFITTVVERAAAGIIRDRWAQKRDSTGIQSLDVPTQRGNVNALPDSCSNGRDEYRHDLAIDLDGVVAALPDDLRAIAVRLKAQSADQVADELNISRATLYRQMHRLRRAFAKAGLHKYL